jgi:tRNA U34 5-methylaminomethyl-2-thiouridine-forming methyltransferase MnmC
MTIPDRETYDSVDSRWMIRVTDDGSPTLVDRVTGDSMHSGCGAIAETAHVYLHNGGIAERLQQRKPSRILEVGLGTGLGCLLSADAANRFQTPIDYVALENNLAPAGVVAQLADKMHGIEPLLIQSYCELLRSVSSQSMLKGSVGPYCELTVHLGDAANWEGVNERLFDAIYFDPYSPDANPELWSAPVLATMRRHLSSTGRLVSYCVNRRVRDTLIEVGFVVNRVRGPIGGKREVLVATCVD